MIAKLFPRDKNYILRQAQYVKEDEFIGLMIMELKRSYTILYNPLQIMDQTYSKIINTNEVPLDRVRIIYRQLCGIYRYKNDNNQLEFLFDGRTHLEKFQDDWAEALLGYLRQLAYNEQYVKTMLRMTLLFDTDSRAQWAENNCKSFISQYFDLKFVKRRGELLLKVS